MMPVRGAIIKFQILHLLFSLVIQACLGICEPLNKMHYFYRFLHSEGTFSVEPSNL